MSDLRTEAERELRADMAEKRVIFRRLVVSLLALIAATFALVVWVVGQPTSHDEQLSQQPAALWPDGSPHTTDNGG